MKGSKEERKAAPREKLAAVKEKTADAFRKGRSRFQSMSRKKQLAGIVAAGLVVTVGGHFAVQGLFGSKVLAAEYTEYEVARGDVQTTVSGSGTITPVNQYEVKATVQGDVLTDTFEEGDTVEKDQLLYTIDSSDMENTIERANLSLEKSQMEYKDSQKAVTGLNVTSTIAGKVAELYVARGDSVQSGTQVARIVDDTCLTAKVPFSQGDVASLSVGQSVTVTVENTFEQLTGRIEAISNGSRILEGYMTVVDVTVSVNNPGALQEGTYVSVSANGVTSQAGGQLEYETEKIIKAETSGTVTSIVSGEGTYVSKGSVLVQMENESAADTLKNSSLTLREAQLSYENTAKQLEDYSITAPISGSIIEKNVKAGDTIDNTSSQTVMAVIADMSQLIFTISVDELDIAGLEKGQEVTITADALPDQTFTGYVDNIGLNGTSQNGVTTYPVKVVVNDPEGLWPGMNVTAEIITDSAEDVLRIPTSAVQRGDTVLLSDYTQQKVELGISDENYIEITEGLSEGDKILVPAVSASSDSSQEGMMPGGGMPGGGSPGGGMPSGGGAPGGAGGGGGRGGM